MDSERKFTKAMTLKERLYMPPLEKYLVYDKFPWKLVIHILLVILTTSQVVLMVIPNSQYSFNQYVIWIKLFCNLNAGQDDTDVSNSFNLFSIKDVNTFVNATVDVIFLFRIITTSIIRQLITIIITRMMMILLNLLRCMLSIMMKIKLMYYSLRMITINYTIQLAKMTLDPLVGIFQSLLRIF